MSETWVWRDGEVTITKAAMGYVVWKGDAVAYMGSLLSVAVVYFVRAVKGG